MWQFLQGIASTPDGAAGIMVTVIAIAMIAGVTIASAARSLGRK